MIAEDSDPKWHGRVLHALRDMRRRLERAESGIRESEKQAKAAVIGFAHAIAAPQGSLSETAQIGQVCRNAAGAAGSMAPGAAAAVFAVRPAGSRTSFAGWIADDLSLRGIRVDIDAGHADLAYAIHLAVQAIARSEVTQALVAGICLGAGKQSAALFLKSPDRAATDGDTVLARLGSSAEDVNDYREIPAQDVIGELTRALEEAGRQPGQTTVMAGGVSLEFAHDAMSRFEEGPIEQRISALVSQVLRQPAGHPIPSDARLFDYGLDSLTAVDIRDRLQRLSGKALPLTLLFECPTVRALAAYLAGTDGPAPKREPMAESNGEPFPMSHGQTALWAMQALDPASPAYNIRCALFLNAPVPVEILDRALSLVLLKHPVLRARFMETDRKPVQVIDPPPARLLEVTRASGWTVALRDEWLLRHSLEPFDLAHGPLARFRFLMDERPQGRVEPELVLLMVFHHIVIDFLSIRVVLDDLLHFYSEISAGREPVVCPEYGFFSHVRRERAWLQESEEKLWHYWKQALAGNLPILRPPSGRVRNADSYRGGIEYRCSIDSAIMGRVAAYGRSESATTFQVMFAAYALLLMEECKQDELIVGTTLSGRDSSREMDAAGYFVNPLPVRFESRSHGTWADYFATYRRRMVELIEFQQMPFPRLVERLLPRREPFVSPVFQTMFTWLASSDPGSTSLLRDEMILSGHQPAGVTHDLVLIVTDLGTQLRCSWCYRQPLFEPEDIESLARRYAGLLGRIVDDPRMPLHCTRDEKNREEVVL